MIVDAGGIRASFPSWIPNWLANRVAYNAGFRFLWVIALTCDFFIQAMLEGFRASLPGIGTSTALGAIGIGRGIIRGPEETDASYAARLVAWRDTAREQGRQLGIATQLHGYIPGSPKVSVINRAGTYTIVELDGSIVTGTTTLWDWDSVSNPDRASDWSDEWVVVYPDPWPYSTALATGNTLGQDNLGVGHDDTIAEYGDMHSILDTFKAAHSNIRAVIFTSDPTLFDFDNAGTLPDGNWGRWSQPISFSGALYYFPSDRNEFNCKFWTPSLP